MFNWGKKQIVFILGCQRSGTTVCQNAFRDSTKFHVYGEGSRLAMTPEWRLRSYSDIDRLMRSSRRKFLLFKPLNDSQLARDFLRQYAGLKIIWLCRSMPDTVNSAVRKWGAAQRDMVVWLGDILAAGYSTETRQEKMASWPSSAIYAERLSDDSREKLVRWTRGPVSDHDGAAIMWYLRNQLYFEQELDRNADTLLISYEALVQEPAQTMRKLCEFIGATYNDELVRDIHASSVGRSSSPSVAHHIQESCDELALQFKQAGMILPQAVSV